MEKLQGQQKARKTANQGKEQRKSQNQNKSSKKNSNSKTPPNTLNASYPP
jgi:hypothetical protein